MPTGSTFLDELARLNQQNFLGGLAEGAQAVKEQRQNESLINLYNQFRVKQQGLKTTEEQLGEFSKSPIDINTPESMMADKIATLTQNYTKILQQKNAYNDLYQPYITALATLGDEGVKVASTLSKELEQKKEMLGEKADIPLKALEYEANLTNLIKAKADIEVDRFKLNQLKESVAAQKMLTNFTNIKSIKDSIFNKVLIFDKATGKTNFDMHKLYEEAYKIYGSDPSFNPAWILLNDYVKNHLEQYDSSDLIKARLAAAQSENERIVGFADLYSNAKDMAEKYVTITTDPTYAEARREYYDALGVDSKKNPRDVQLGSDPQIIAKMPDGYAKERMKYIYDHFYDKENNQYYWDYIDQMEGALSTQYYKQTGMKQKVHIKPDKSLNVGGMYLDTSKLILGHSGEPGDTFYNPGWQNPSVGYYEHYDRTVEKQTKKMETKKSAIQMQKSYNTTKFVAGKE